MTRDYWRFIPLALLAGFIAFPARITIRGQPLPDLPTRADLTKDMPPDATLFHWLKNLLSELVRADPRWWGQCACFVIGLLAIMMCVVLGVAAAIRFGVP